MSKKWLIIAGVVAIGAVLGLGVFQTNADSIEPASTNENIKEQIEMEYPGEITEFEIEKEDGRTIYEIEIEGDGVEYDLEVDGETGQILEEEREEKENKSVKKSREQVTEQGEIISLEEAKAIALKKFDGTVKEVEYEKDDGRYEYSIEIENGEDEAEFEIDAVTGKIIEFEIDRD